MFRFLRPKVPLVLLGLLVCGLLWVGTQLTLTWALKREARFIGLDWIHHIENQLSGLAGATKPDGSWDPTTLPDPQELRHLMSGIIEIGHIYQFDYINVICYCHVSLTAADPKAGSGAHQHELGRHVPTDNQSGHDHSTHADAHENVVGSVPKGLWKHVVKGSKPHPNPKSNQPSAHDHPIDRELVTRMVDSQSHDILIRRSDNPEFPSTFAEVYHPVTNGTEVLYLLRVLVNLEEQAQFYKQLILMAAAVGAILLGAAVGYPTWRYIRAVRLQRQSDQRVAFLANHDVLTNLYNRNNFQETVSDILWTAHEREQFALLFLFDLDDFKEINDFYGHPVGDRVLCEFAKILKDTVPENGYIARLGGDEFVVVISGIDEKEFEYGDVLTLPEVVSITINGGSQTVSAGISGGVVRFPRDAETTEELIQLADLALYAAKSTETAEICEYVPELKDAFVDRLRIRDDFREALKASQIEPYYQPIVNLKTGRVEGFEALARWNHPEKGVLTPFVFGEVLEGGEISAQLGRQMFAKILQEMSMWQRTAVSFGKVALNVTDGDLKSDRFADNILDGLADHGLAPGHLTIEVTENCLFGPENKDSIGHFERLRDAGCFVALDDFGTGYSSITQLKALPITAIKIDKSFIDDVLDCADDQSIIAAMLELGKSMLFSLVMEGIETSRQLELLKLMGSELAQGYYFSRPLPAAEVPAFIERQNSSYGEDFLQLKAS